MKKLILLSMLLLSGCATTRTYGTCARTNTLYSDDGDSNADVYLCKVIVTSSATAETSSNPKPHPIVKVPTQSEFDKAFPVGE